jgi:uncharacterized protein (DUF2147 family)
MKRGAWLIAAAGLCLLAAPAIAAPPVEGVWRTPNAEVRMGACPSHRDWLCGVVTSMREPLDAAGHPKRDVHNPDPAQRQRPLIGITLLSDLRPAGEGRWEGGKIYDPRSGKSIDAKARLTDKGALKVEACFGAFCGGQTWRRED